MLLGPLKIVLRKSCWDASIDDLLLAESSTLNLLYIQTVADVERGWIQTSAETKQELALMQVGLTVSKDASHKVPNGRLECYFIKKKFKYAIKTQYIPVSL